MGEMKVEITETKNGVPDAQKPEVKQEVIKEEPRYVTLEDLEKVNQAINNTREYNNRKIQDVLDKLDKIAPKAPEPKPDDLDELVQKDWKAGVKAVVRDVMTEHQRATSAQTEEQRVAQLLEESKRKVMEKHPELSDPDSPKTKAFLKVIDDNPDLKTNPRGPLLAMYEMENLTKTHANVEIERPQRVEKEVRQKAGGVPHGTQAGNKGGYVMTKQDVDFCRLNGINPESYKRVKGAKEAQV